MIFFKIKIRFFPRITEKLGKVNNVYYVTITNDFINRDSISYGIYSLKIQYLNLVKNSENGLNIWTE